MQQALPYRVWLSPTAQVDSASQRRASFKKEDGGVSVKTMVVENAVLLFGKRGCCMCHAMKRLLVMLGVNPAVYEVDEDEEELVITELCMAQEGEGGGGKTKQQFPTIFIGGKLFGGLDRLMSAHISGELIPLLKQAGALWL